MYAAHEEMTGMEEEKSPVEITDIGVVNVHDHLCLMYRDDEELLGAVLPFIQGGLSLGERCVYLHAAEKRLEEVLQNAVDGNKEDSGALILLPLRQTWLRGGALKQDRIMELLGDICSGAASDGFSGTRIVCDMSWALRDTKSQQMLHHFERNLTAFAAASETALLCLYDRRSFGDERLLDLARIHPSLICSGRVCENPLHLPVGMRAPVLSELDTFFAASHRLTAVIDDGERLKNELEQAYSALAKKIYENWQEEDTLRATEKEMQEKDEALLANRRRQYTILQHLPAIMLAFDSGDRLAACNHEFERVTGFRGEEVMGKAMLELLHVEAEQREEVVVHHPREGGDYRGREWRLRCKDGSLRLVSWSNISHYVPVNGWANWILGIDVTPRVAEPALRTAKEELEVRTAELEAFGQAISHDLAGRLARISGDCSGLKQFHAPQLAPGCRELLQDIEKAAAELAGPIEALKRMTALTATGIRPVVVDLSAMAAEIAAQLSGAARRPVDFRIEDGVTVTGDKEMLRLAMEQLLENAWHSTMGVKHPVIRFGTAQVRGERSIYVSDNGPRDAEAPGEPDGKGQGERICCGIGLATVQRIINLHRGRIWSAEQAGKGGTLYFQV